MLAITGDGHFVRWLQTAALSLSLLALLALSGAVRARDAVAQLKARTAPTPLYPVNLLEWAVQLRAHPRNPGSGAKAPPLIDPSVAPARAGDPTEKPTPPPNPIGAQSDESTQPIRPRTFRITGSIRLDRLCTTRCGSPLRTLIAGSGPRKDDAVYRQVYGSIAPGGALHPIRWAAYADALQHELSVAARPTTGYTAFVGRFDPNEFITERDEPSGAIPRTYGPPTEDQTLLGIGYHQPDKQGSRFDAGAGIRLRSPLDPYIKGSYIFERGKSETGLFSVRETLFWQNSEGVGETTRLDLEKRIF